MAMIMPHSSGCICVLIYILSFLFGAHDGNLTHFLSPVMGAHFCPAPFRIVALDVISSGTLKDRLLALNDETCKTTSYLGRDGWT